MTPPTRLAHAVLASILCAGVLGGCGVEPLKGPCLEAGAVEMLEVPFGRLEGVSHEGEGGIEVAMFRFDRAVPGATTIRLSPAAGQYRELRSDEPISVDGARPIEVRMTGLVGGADTDRLRAAPREEYAIREIVQVSAQDGAAWIIAVDGSVCIRVRTSSDAATMTILVTASE